MLVNDKIKEKLLECGCQLHVTNEKLWVYDDEYNKKYPDPEIPIDLFRESSTIFSCKEGYMKEKNITLEDAQDMVEYWKEEILRHENSDGAWAISGRMEEDYHNLEFWRGMVDDLLKKQNGETSESNN